MELVPSLWGVYAGAALLSTTVVVALYKSVAYSTGFFQLARDAKQMTSTAKKDILKESNDCFFRAKESVNVVFGFHLRKLLVTSLYAAVAAAMFGVSVPTFLRGLGQPVPADVPPVVFREWADRTHHLQVSSHRA